jgi:hypothetical protein
VKVCSILIQDCCTEDEAHDWGYEELMQPSSSSSSSSSSLWGVPYKGSIQLDGARVKPVYTSSR